MLTFHRPPCDSAMQLTHQTYIIAFHVKNNMKILTKVCENGIKIFIQPYENAIQLCFHIVIKFLSFSNTFVSIIFHITFHMKML